MADREVFSACGRIGAITAAAVALLTLIAAGAPQAQAAGGGDPTFAYVANSGGGVDGASVGAYSVNQKTGALTPIAGSPFASGDDTNWVVVHPNGKFLYATNENDSTISVYSISNKTGALTPIAGSPFATGDRPNCPRISPSKKFLYVANEEDQTISVFSIDKKSGALTEIGGSPFPVTGATFLTDSIAITRNGRFAYVTDDNDPSPSGVFGFAIDKKTGALSPIAGSPFLAGDCVDSVVVDRQSKFAFAANFCDETVSVFSINRKTGALTEVPGSPFDAQGSTDKLAISKNGRFLYAANDGADGPSGVGGFRIDRKSGALSPVPGSPFVTGDSSTSSTSGVAVDPTGRFLYAANENGHTLSVFSIDKKTGALTEISGSPFTGGAVGTEPVDIAIRRKTSAGVSVSPK